MGLFGKKKEKENKSELVQEPTPVVNNQDKKTDKKSDKKNPEEINLTNKIKVIIYRELSAGLFGQVGKPFIVEEKKDANNNLIAINEEQNFKEDFNFSRDNIFDSIELALGISGANKKTKLVKLNEMIKNQKELLENIEKDVTKNSKYNYPDEELKLDKLKLLKESLRKERVGNYMRLGEGGIRQVELVSVDGILFPYFFGAVNMRAYVDLTTKKKIFNQENTIFRNEVGGTQKNVLNWLLIIGFVIGFLLIGLGAWMIKYGYDKTEEVTLVANQGAIACTNALATINQNYALMIDDYKDLKTSQQNANNINNQNPNTNSGGGIIVDPTKLIK